MRFFDLHCDTITELCKKQGSLALNDGHISLDRASYLTEYVQDYAIFIPDEYRGKEAVDYFDKVYAYYKNEMNKNGISEYADRLDTKFKSVLSVEGGAGIGGTIEGLYHLADCGVKLITLTWNGRNELASGCFDEEDIGLTSFGREAVKEMENLRIAADVSHLSVKGFYDLADLADKPFMASHSCIDIVDNFKAKHRNLTKDQVKIIAEHGGVIGINLWEKLLGNEDNSFDAVLRHMSEIIEIGGEDIVSMGTDFDGCDINDELAGIEKIPVLYDFLGNHGFSENLLDKIFFSNADRFFANLLFTK
ncbi:MAG: membrane dipeptidase [Clostridia bacterium]|nr:membrane dipeptidase [Clostridia bacterium]